MPARPQHTCEAQHRGRMELQCPARHSSQWHHRHRRHGRVVVVNVVVVVVTGDRLLAINWMNDGRERIIIIATGWRHRVDAVG